MRHSGFALMCVLLAVAAGCSGRGQSDTAASPAPEASAAVTAVAVATTPAAIASAPAPESSAASPGAEGRRSSCRPTRRSPTCS